MGLIDEATQLKGPAVLYDSPLTRMSDIQVDRPKPKLYSVSEMFGPTMQGEGIQAGKLCCFLRLHFCDGDGQGHWCSWCDTAYTWDPKHPDFSKYTRMSIDEIMERLAKIWEPYPQVHRPWVTLSGGNPVMQMDGVLIGTLRTTYRVQVETQGSIYKDAVEICDLVVVSPKPPSSGLNPPSLVVWCQLPASRVSFKIVIFDQKDFDWAVDVYDVIKHANDKISVYLQVGSDTEGDIVESIVKRYAWLVETWLEGLKEGKMTEAILLPQLHALVWGRLKGK